MSESLQTDQVERDLRIIVGGNFTPHALLGEFRAILERLHAAPGAYLDAFERDYIARGLDARILSRLHVDAFLDRMRPFAPERVRTLAQQLLRQYDGALAVADHAREQDFALTEALPGQLSRFVQRLEEQRQTLRALVGGPAGQR